MPRSQYSLLPQGFLADDFSPMVRSMRRAIDSALQDFWEPSKYIAGPREFQPEISVSENEREIRVQAELPGMKESDVEIVYEPGCLILKGEKREEEQRESKLRGMKFSEWRYGAFERRLPLRADIQEGQIQANYDRGVLTVILPKTEQARAQARRIQVKEGPPPQIEQVVTRGRGEQPGQGAVAQH